MKNLLTLLMTILVFTSCKKEDPISCNIAKATINGIEWNTSTHALGLEESEEFFSLVLHDADENNFLLLSHGYSHIPRRVGVNKLVTAPWTHEDKVSAGFWFLEDDLQLASYELIEADSLTNHLTVDYYNETTQEVKGRFQSTFTVRPPNAFNQADTVRVIDGSFSVVITGD